MRKSYRLFNMLKSAAQEAQVPLPSTSLTAGGSTGLSSAPATPSKKPLSMGGDANYANTQQQGNNYNYNVGNFATPPKAEPSYSASVNGRQMYTKPTQPAQATPTQSQPGPSTVPSGPVTFKGGRTVNVDTSGMDWARQTADTAHIAVGHNGTPSTWMTDDQYAMFDNVRNQLKTSGLSPEKAKKYALYWFRDQQNIAAGGQANYDGKYYGDIQPKAAPASAPEQPAAAQPAPAQQRNDDPFGDKPANDDPLAQPTPAQAVTPAEGEQQEAEVKDPAAPAAEPAPSQPAWLSKTDLGAVSINQDLLKEQLNKRRTAAPANTTQVAQGVFKNGDGALIDAFGNVIASPQDIQNWQNSGTIDKSLAQLSSNAMLVPYTQEDFGDQFQRKGSVFVGPDGAMRDDRGDILKQVGELYQTGYGDWYTGEGEKLNRLGNLLQDSKGRFYNRNGELQKPLIPPSNGERVRDESNVPGTNWYASPTSTMWH